MKLIQRDAFRAYKSLAHYVVPVPSNPGDLFVTDVQFQPASGFTKRAGPVLDSFAGFRQGERLLADPTSWETESPVLGLSSRESII